jgi:hypothetical protein
MTPGDLEISIKVLADSSAVSELIASSWTFLFSAAERSDFSFPS